MKSSPSMTTLAALCLTGALLAGCAAPGDPLDDPIVRARAESDSNAMLDLLDLDVVLWTADGRVDGAANTAQGITPDEKKRRPFKVSIKKIASDEMVIEDETVVLQQVVKIRIHEAEFRLHVDRLTNEGIYFTLIRLFEP